MSVLQEVRTWLMIVALLPALYAIMRGWTRTPDPKFQRRSAIAMVVSVIGIAIAIVIGGIGQVLDGDVVWAVISGLTLGLLVLAVVIAGTHLRAARHLVRTGERLEFTEAEERRMRILVRILFVLGIALFAVVIVVIFGSMWWGR